MFLVLYWRDLVICEHRAKSEDCQEVPCEGPSLDNKIMFVWYAIHNYG